MRINGIVKIAGCGLLAYLTATITSAIYAQQPRNAVSKKGHLRRGQTSARMTVPVPKEPVKVVTKMTSQVVRDPRAMTPVEPRNFPQQGSVASASLRTSRVTVNGRRVIIEGLGYVYDIRGQIYYIWSAVITDSNGEETARLVYRDRQFTLPPSREADHLLVDGFDLLPGNYTIKVALSEIAPGQDPATIGLDPSRYLLSFTRRVSIPR